MTAHRANVFALVTLLSGAALAHEAPIRDLRPLQIERGDKVTVEASAPVFTVGAPTRVTLEQAGLTVTGRAVSATRILFDADRAFEVTVLRAGVSSPVPTTVSVEQLVGDQKRTFQSARGWPFEVELFPATLHRLAQQTVERVGAEVFPEWLVFALLMLLAAVLIAIPAPVIGGFIVVWERKISAYMQSRFGPNRVGPNGWLQWLADGLKLILKEDLIPADADPILFKLAPFLAFVGLFLVFMVLPFSPWVIVADLNIGLLFLLSITSLVVVSIIMGGWSSNSKWSLLGGMRSAAQIVSYELPASVALLSIATLTGSLSTEAIVRAQGGAPWDWYLFHNPFTFLCFFIYFISALAEGNRTPFDLPEAESELVSGYNTEYSGFRFAIYPLVEWINLFVIGAVAGMLFCGGWQVPGLTAAEVAAHGYWQALGFGVYALKIVAFVFVTIWVRWTLPRFRVDQMMSLCWKFFIPIAFACFVAVLAYTWLVPAPIQMAMRYVTFVICGLVPLVFFWRRVQYNRSRYQELKLNPLL